MTTVSRETIDRLKIYQGLLEVWQKKINLVSPSSLSHSWKRHFEDSLQLLSYIPQETSTLIDLGSGAGFPGLVLAIALPQILKVTLIESDIRKCLFLETVSRETKIPVIIKSERIESIKDIKADIITARALAPLSLLLDYTYPFMNENSQVFFLKGKGVTQEIQEAKKKWDFDLEIFQSLTDSTGRILKINRLRRISSHV